MEETQCYESFPAWIVVLCNLVGNSIYAVGAYILSRFGIWVSAAYLLYCLWMEIGVLRKSCVNCTYYGQVCAFGKGKLCSLLFKQGDPQAFASTEVSWYKLLPDLLVSIIPVVGGVVLLARQFSWLLLGALAILVVLSSVGNAFVRGSFACKYCRQREIGCPAANLFGSTDGVQR